MITYLRECDFMGESRELEFKQEISNSFLKTVSAFSNIRTGIIRFGIDDYGKFVGLDDLEKKCLDIETRINESIFPKPNYKFDINYENKTIDLIVYEGLNKPYFYKSKAYKRNDSSSIEMDYLELQRVILEDKNLYFEELPYEGDLTFKYLNEKLQEKLNIEINNDILKTLGLINVDNSYNKAASLLSDSNRFSGIDIIKFGDDINMIMDRLSINNCSLFKQYDEAFDMFEKYYKYESIEESTRKTLEKIPSQAFREALANALVHRVWDDTPNIRISMFQDKITVTSPGGLPTGISKDEYLNGQVSKLRNPIIANVFFRLKYIEIFGTGILRIKHFYKENDIQPDFIINENSITIVLPLLNSKVNVTEDEGVIFNYLKRNMQASCSDLVYISGFNKSKVLRIIKKLSNKGYVKTIGKGKNIKYKL